MSYKVDLHTHSVASSDGGLKLAHYKYFLDNKLLDYIAVTDHGTIDFALQAQQSLGEKIIVGQEVTTLDGDIIGLYLTKQIKSGMSAADTAKDIKAQGGLVYVPHPFETVRSGISEKTLGEIIQLVDIIETFNGRAFLQNKNRLAREWAEQANKATAASSDTHGRYGWGFTYSVVDKKPTVTTLVTLLANADQSRRRVGIGVIYPKLNRIKKLLHL